MGLWKDIKKEWTWTSIKQSWPDILSVFPAAIFADGFRDNGWIAWFSVWIATFIVSKFILRFIARMINSEK